MQLNIFLANLILNRSASTNGKLQENVRLFVEHGGGEVFCPLLASSDQEIVASVAGALQSVCYQVSGR